MQINIAVQCLSTDFSSQKGVKVSYLQWNCVPGGGRLTSCKVNCIFNIGGSLVTRSMNYYHVCEWVFATRLIATVEHTLMQLFIGYLFLLHLQRRDMMGGYGKWRSLGIICPLLSYENGQLCILIEWKIYYCAKSFSLHHCLQWMGDVYVYRWRGEALSNSACSSDNQSAKATKQIDDAAPW